MPESGVAKQQGTLLPKLPFVDEDNLLRPISGRFRKIPRRRGVEDSAPKIDVSLAKKFKIKTKERICQSLHSNMSSTHDFQPQVNIDKALLPFPSKKDCSPIKTDFEDLSARQAKRVFFQVYTHKASLNTRPDNRSNCDSVIETVLRDLDDYRLLPKGIDFINQSQNNGISLKRQALGKGDRLKMLGNFIQSPGKCPKVDLSQNLLGHKYSRYIIQKMLDVETIDLSGNSVGTEGVTALITLFRNPLCLVRHLNISSNGLTDNILSMLIKELETYPIGVLNISKNQFGRRTSSALRRVIKLNIIEQLSVGWGNLGQTSCCWIVDAVANNSSLKFLDISWNNVGHFEKVNDSLVRMVRKNKHLMHLDLSYCNLNLNKCRVLSAELGSNHTLVGLHLQGSPAFMDGRGYLNQVCVESTDGRLQQTTQVRPTNSHLGSAVCWICQGWRQFRLSFRDQEGEYFVHFDFEGYQGLRMEFDGVSYTLQRFVPPTKAKFFLSRKTASGDNVFLLENFQKIKVNLRYNKSMVREVNQSSQLRDFDSRDSPCYVESRHHPKLDPYCQLQGETNSKY